MPAIKKSLILICLLLSGFIQQGLFAQCTSPVSSFPYFDDFEASNGNWVKSNSDHWEWGQIFTKPVITAAASGTKCWLVGGFSTSSYNSGNSFLQSPCFDISALINPQVSFKIFWETERRFDGAAFQYSLDGGSNWLNLGSVNSNANCEGSNWFNVDPVNFLAGPGWSGNIQSTSGSCVGGGGSGSWLTATHSLSSIAGATEVIFRFSFAAGLTCNEFDGFAMDDFEIGEAAPNSVDFNYTCSANSAVAFNSSITGCKTGLSWDFGDPASGSNNISSVDNPTHSFSAPGNYTVTLTTNFVSGPPIVITKNISVIAVSASLVGSIRCNSDQSVNITANVNPPGTYNYSWDTNPVQTTATINNMGAGTYTVTVSGTNVCSVSLPVTLVQPAMLTQILNISDATCGSGNGVASVTVTGGTVPYSYTWSNGSSTASASNLFPGTYSLFVLDANGCAISTINIRVNNIALPVSVFLGNDTTICPGEKLVLNPGNFSSYIWQDNSVTPTYSVTASGLYSVSVTDAAGCKGTDSIRVTVECTDVYFPSAFTPNGDGVNDGFGPLPLTALPTLKNYRLNIYGRWGELIFSAADPYSKWDGRYKGKFSHSQTYTWVATYSVSDKIPVIQKGTVIVIR